MRPNQQFIDSLNMNAITESFTTGIYGGILMMPVNLGFTASQSSDSLSGKLTYYSLSTLSDSSALLNDRNSWYDNGIWQDGTNWGTFDLAVSKPNFDWSADYSEQPFGGGQYTGGEMIQNAYTFESPKYYNYLQVPITRHPNLTDVMTTGWCVLRWNIKASTTITLLTRNQGSSIQRGHKIYFYDAISANSYGYSLSASNIALYMKDYNSSTLYAS